MGLAQDAVWWVWLGVHTWTVLGVRPRLMWGAVWQPCALLSAVVVGLWRGHCGSGGWWVVRGKLTLQQLLWQCMSTPCSTLHTL